jgi:prephenate dehydrogenase
MGQRLAEEFAKDGYEVHLTGAEPPKGSDRSLPEQWRRAVRRWDASVCKDADVVVFSVPIPILSDGNGLARIFGRTPRRGWRDKLVMDVCSTKARPLQALCELRGASIIGTHPMFGPKVRSLVGQTVFLCPVLPPTGNKVLHARLEVRKQWLGEFWQRRGVNVVEIAPDQHDQLMPALQFGVLLSVLLYGEGLKQSGVPLDRLERVGTPNSRALCARLARMISPTMLATYVNLAIDNPNNIRWLEVASETVTRLRDWMATGNRQAMLDWMQQLVTFQPASFRDYYTASSVFVDECLARRDFVAACLDNEARVQSLLNSMRGAMAQPHLRAA